MTTRSPRVAFAARIRSCSCAAVTVLYCVGRTPCRGEWVGIISPIDEPGPYPAGPPSNSHGFLARSVAQVLPSAPFAMSWMARSTDASVICAGSLLVTAVFVVFVMKVILGVWCLSRAREAHRVRSGVVFGVRCRSLGTVLESGCGSEVLGVDQRCRRIGTGPGVGAGCLRVVCRCRRVCRMLRLFVGSLRGRADGGARPRARRAVARWGKFLREVRVRYPSTPVLCAGAAGRSRGCHGGRRQDRGGSPRRTSRHCCR